MKHIGRLVFVCSVGYLASTACLADYIDIYSNQPGYVLTKELNAAATKLAEGKLLAAEGDFKAILAKQPSSPAALLGLADIAHLRKDNGGVSRYLRRAVKIAPNNAAVQTAWGRYRYLGENYAAAEAIFLRAIELDSELPDPHGELGALYFARLDEPEKAMFHYQEAIRLAPTVLDYRYALSTVLSTQQKPDLALEVLAKAATISPDQPYVYQLQSNILAAHGRYAEAIKALDSANSIEPGIPQIYWARGELFMALGDSESALESYRAMLLLNPAAAPAYARIGLIHQLEGDFEQSEKAYLEALRIEPGFPMALNNLAFAALAQSGRSADAVEWAQQAVAAQPENPEFLDTLGLAHHANGQPQEALEDYDRALGIAPEYASAHYHIGLLYDEMGSTEKAVEHYRKALATHTESSEIELMQNRLAAIQSESGQ